MISPSEAAACPDLLVTQAGRPVTTPEQWRDLRRVEILELFRRHVYGRNPVARPQTQRIDRPDGGEVAMDGTAIRHRLDVAFRGPGGEGRIPLLLFLPVTASAAAPVPVFLLICNRERENIAADRSVRSPFWPAEEGVARGYAMAAIHVEDIDPDHDDGFRNGVHALFDPPTGRTPDAWGTIGAWAWGASRAMDALETVPEIDRARVALVGHSRGGKTALWCGAQDERFALVVSNESGCTGAALSRGKQGEDIATINRAFPHWFCENYRRFGHAEASLPVDQHMLLALIAPRLLYVASAEGDGWSDPPAEFRSCVLASPVYGLLGRPGIAGETLPPVDTPVHGGAIGYHLRTGEHDLTPYDWHRFMDFADRHWRDGAEPCR